MPEEQPATEPTDAVVPVAESEEDKQRYFEQLAAVHNSILEGVITYW
jgi:hypothetical protein